MQLCSGKYVVKGEKGYGNRHVDERELEQALINDFNEIVGKRKVYIEVR